MQIGNKYINRVWLSSSLLDIFLLENLAMKNVKRKIRRFTYLRSNEGRKSYVF